MKLGKSILFIALAVFLACSSAFALSAQEAMAKSQAWFKTANAWSLDFKLQVFYAESPDIASQQGSLLVAEGNRFKLDIAGNRHAVVRNRRRTELLVENHITTFRAERHLYGVRQRINAAAERAAGFLTKQNLLCHVLLCLHIS